jgi:hypothetical protein
MILKNRRFIAAFLVFIMTVITIIGNGYEVKAADTFKTLPPIQGVKANHEFSIRLSREVDETTLIDGAVKIYEKDTLKAVDIIIRRDTYDAKLIKVKGKSNFEIGKTYTLEVRNLKSKKNEYFKQAYRVDFTVKSAYTGLPAEDGLIIVGNKAYAIDYLKKNVWMVNEIITKNFDVYYIYDVNYQKIRSLFNIGAVNSSNLNPDHTPISYIDSDGNKHLYIWREDRQEYERALPKAYVEVITRSDAKAVSINVSSVSSVPDAKYYSLKSSNLIKNFGEPVGYITSENAEEISILSEDRSVLAKGIVSIDRNFGGEITLKLLDSLNSGNSAANINNNGIAAGYNDGYIYYVNNADKERLYKQSIGGAFNRVIVEDKVQYVNESGDWVYYSNYADGGKLYKAKKDGTLKQKMLDEKAAYVTISGQDIYYSNHSKEGKLYRVKKDLSDAVTGADGLKRGNPVTVNYGNYNGSSDEVAYINVVGDWIYYSNYSDGHKPYVVHKAGTFRGKLSDSYADCLQVQGDWIYFTSDSGTISKINKNMGTSVMPIKATTTEYNKGYHINVNGDWIFYSNAQDGGKLYKINTDGSGNSVKLSEESVGYINVVGDWIYFTTLKGKLYRLLVASNGQAAAEEVSQNKDPNKIVEIQNINVTVEHADVDQSASWLENKYLPQKVAATMGDNTMQQLVVAWDTNPKSVVVKDGVRTYKGSVIGYSTTITLVMTIPSQMLNDTNNITIYKNGNKNDTVIVEGNNSNVLKTRITEGDVITVWDKYDKLLGTASVGKDGKATVSKLDLNNNGDSIFIKVKRGIKAPSNSTEVRLYNVPVVKSVDTVDNDIVGLGVDVRDITVGKWAQAMFDTYKSNALDKYYSLTSQEVYILPSKTLFNMATHTTLDTLKVTRDDIPVSSGGVPITSWTGLSLGANSSGAYPSKDSQGQALKAGTYDVYISNSFTGKGSEDISGYRPNVVGKIANSAAATFTMVGEGLPVKPTIKYQRVQGSGNNLSNDKVLLDKPLLEGETAWLVPVSIIDQYKVRGWRTDMGDDKNPFKAMVKDNQDVSSATGAGITVMKAPRGDISPSHYDTDYKLFIVNDIGVSPESDNKIVVDNKSPEPGTGIYPTTFYVGDPIFVSSNEKGKVYVVPNLLDISSLENLDNAVKAQNGFVVNHNGGNISVSILRSETLQEFIIPIISTDVEADYKIVGVDEAGNISVGKPIKIIKYITEFYELYKDGEDKAKSATVPPVDLLATLAKCQTLLGKVSVKQSEINQLKDELLAKLNRLKTSLTMTSTDKRITFGTNTMNVFQMTISQLLSKLSITPGAIVKIIDENDVEIPKSSYGTLIKSGMQIQATDGVSPLGYTFYVDAAYDISTAQELLHAIEQNPTISKITMVSTPSAIVIDRPINLDVARVGDLTIEGKFGGNTVIQFNNGGSINNITSKVLTLKNINFTGIGQPRTDNVISNTGKGSIIIDNCSFNGFEFRANNVSVIRSNSGAKLALTNSKFNLIYSDSNTFSHVYISSEAFLGTKVENNFFYGTIAGKDVKGIEVEGNNIASPIEINRNTFTGFVSKAKSSMSIPVYVNGGSVNFSGNNITSSEAGLFVDLNRNFNTNSTLNVADGSANYAEVGSLINGKNRVSNNYYGDIVIGKLESGKIPVIYYNSTLTPTIADVTLDADKKLVIQGNAADFRLKVSDSLQFIAPPQVGKAAEGYSAYDSTAAMVSGKYVTIVQVDSKNAIQKYRQLYIP